MNELSTRIKAAIETQILTDNRKSTTLYPSSASIDLSKPAAGKNVVGTCLRQQYYRTLGTKVTNKTPADVKVASMIGDKITLMVQDILDTHGFACQLQRVVAEHNLYVPKINLSGRCDFIAYDHSAKEYIGIEVKSVGEYKASKTVTKPADEHVLQSLIYLDYYTKNNPELAITKWYILYISRTENYAIKSRKHGSPLTMIWDYIVTMDKDGSAVIKGPGGTEKWADHNIHNIYKRFERLNSHIACGTLPPRDYSIQYSDDLIVELFKRNELTRKVDIEKVDKWLKKGAPEGKLKVEIGDVECDYCPYKGECWSEFVAKDPEDPFKSMPSSEKKIAKPEEKNDQVPKDWF